MKDKVIFLAGPTAIGKTEIAVYLAQKINAEIISCDSIQVYKGMPIISSQPAVCLRKPVSHHMLEIVSTDREYNVSLYRKAAMRKIKEIIARGRLPLFTGGTGLYMTILLDGIFEEKAKGEAIRQKLYQEADIYGKESLHSRLKDVDAQAALKIHPNDTKRIVRALEVFETTGKTISQLQKQRKGIADKYDCFIFCLNIERDELYRRIEERIKEMFVNGLLDEVTELLKLGLSKTASCAIGIKELKGYFEGEYSLEEAKQKMIRNTKAYSKRQLTWFRKDKRIKWIEIGKGESPGKIAERIVCEYINVY